MDNIEAGDCLARIRAIYSNLKTAEKKAAHYILENPESIIHFSITEFAYVSKVSETTIFRLCNKLGYTGYQDLKINLASTIVKPVENIFEGIKENDDMYIIMQKVMSSSIHSIQKAISMNESTEMEKAVKLILNAKKLMFFGMGGSWIVALDAYHEFIRTGIPCVCNSDSHWQVMYAAMAERNDVIFAFSTSGSNKDLIDSIKVGKKNGAKIISITSNQKSPLQKISDILLTSYGKESMVRSEAMESRITSLVLINSLFVSVALKRLDITLNNLDKIRAGIAVKRY
ncbi:MULTISPECIES: MurR/RpiR family transcriptional regulator [Clostridium]|uniref:HTH-type transcriptional regulator YbbH n=5 Tax=Clostridium TaxID=1485 RepID=D8GR85_CLOLD|nr:MULTISPECIES: MurR/RpiR family transcriptional regulator [Clostridium]ADK14223.1 predicted transcription regulator, PpiR family [Clostridium ljungdahlii DSM 13528]AGY77449.1 MurR/RpiR family transcriptional regulator [Clostridium autoethanogenum DSM 10061]ALU37590.1 Transcriptional regulator RpiR family [Clostridium autoethanogenum DSM 10061]OAA86100.1 putative HTH-type transcriptional regulator YbbH [Clostridium ljungdahlii DSM 13528]OAA92264.1 putative HTH-type transcriptional regulator Y